MRADGRSLVAVKDRITYAALSAAVFGAFLSDTRVNITMIAAVCVAMTYFDRPLRMPFAVSAALLGGSALALLVGSVVLGWAVALVVAVSAGVLAVGPTLKERSAGAR